VIDDVDTAAYTIPTDSPEADGTLSWDSTTLVLVTVRGGGMTGIGWTYGPAACTAIIRNHLAPVVEGTAVMDVGAASDRMIKAIRNLTRAGVAGYAVSAMDVALWDLKARVLELPLHHLIGAVRPEAPIYGSGGFTSYDDRQLAEQLRLWVEDEEIPRVKIKVGESWGSMAGRDIARMRQARAVIGDGVELYVDANGGYTRKQAIRMMRDVDELDVRWLEEPVSSDDLDGLREVRDAVRADVAAGEYGTDIYYFRRMCAAASVDCLQADASRCGGITEWLRAAAVASSYGLQISAHCAPHLHAHVATATPNFRHLEWFHDHARIESMMFEGTLMPAGGAVRPDGDAPGLGLELKRADAEQYRVA